MDIARIGKSAGWVFLIIWSTCYSTLRAENPETSRFSLTPFAGYCGTARLGALVPLPQTADVPPIDVLLEQNAVEGGILLGYALDRRFELQFGISANPVRIMNDIGIGIGGPPLGKRKVSNASLWNVGARIAYGIRLGNVSPYLAAGLGAAILDTTSVGARMKPSIEFGAGTNIRLSRRLRAGLEVRDAISFFNVFEDFGIYYPAVYSSDPHRVQHRLGVRICLGYLF